MKAPDSGKPKPLRSAVNLCTGYFLTFVETQICNRFLSFVKLHIMMWSMNYSVVQFASACGCFVLFLMIVKGLFHACQEIAIILFKNRHCGLGVSCCKQSRLHQGQFWFRSWRDV